ncbi:MAG: amidohydrolase family protein [Gemmatimonadales bacterium]
MDRAPPGRLDRRDHSGPGTSRRRSGAGARRRLRQVCSSLSPEVYAALADQARARRIPFAGHLPRDISLVEAAAAGQRSVEHLGGVGDLAALDSVAVDSVLAILVRDSVWQTPTLSVLRVAADPLDPALASDPRLRYVPVTLAALWGVVRRIAAGDTSAARVAGRRAEWARQRASVGRMWRAGVPILAGTDLPNPYTIPGFSLHAELALLVEAGLPPRAALQAATRNAARFLDAGDSLGTIEVGKHADLVLLDGDPLADIANLSRIIGVVRAGRFLDRNELDGILATVARKRWRPGAASWILAGAIVHRVPTAVRLAALGLLLSIPLAAWLVRRRRRRARAASTGRREGLF